MGKVVLGLAAPHNPNIKSLPDRMSSEVQNKLDSAFGHLKGRLSEASPDCLLILTSDHVTNFFYNNAPMFCLAISDTCTGPALKELSELQIPRTILKVDTTMARGLLDYGIESGIDFSYSQEMILDHAFMVPLSLLTPHMDLPIVPLHINGMLPPRPTAARCYRLGQQIGDYICNHYNGNVAVLASGSFSGDIGGPKMGSIDTALDLEFLDLVKDGKGREMVTKATPETLERAGVANEILIWITLQGVLGDLRPSFTDYICGKEWSTAATLAAWLPNT
jgi:protocatechuate 4,5-dioxygenase beta chain/2,3-dihydroxyphenylpropionate 1,2-dioxygenase